MSIIQKHKKKLVQIFKKEGLELPIGSIEIPKRKEHGDLAVPCFIFAKDMKKPPVQIAQELVDKIDTGKSFEKAECAGPYMNFFIDKNAMAEDLLKSINKDKSDAFRKKRPKRPRNVMVEFCSPNTNKPLHLGHLRNMLLGESVSTLLENSGDEVVRSCLVNDRGIHICKSMVAYDLWGEGTTPKQEEKKGDHLVGDFYVKYSQYQDEELDERAKSMLQKWEDGDRKTLDLWKKMNSWVMKGFEETYEKVGIKFDKYYYESELYDKGKDTIMKAYDQGKFLMKDGAVVAQLEEYGLPDKVLVRSDGTTIYMTQDIFLATKKIEDYNLDASIYVVGSEQELHFKQLFRILEILGYKQAKKCYHLSYGMVNLPDGKMKSREGTVVDADDLIADVKSMAEEEIRKRDDSLPQKELETRAKDIAMAGLKFYLLKHDPSKDMTYDPKESISFDGETGPYVQYTAVRINSIMEKSESGLKRDVDISRLEAPEHDLVSKLAQYQDVLDSATEKMRPNLIANYLIELSQEFNSYYHNTKIVGTGMERERIYLINAVRIVLESGMSLLGIVIPDKM